MTNSQNQSGPWEMYDRLIEQVPADVTVDSVCMGKVWTLLKAGEMTGIAATVSECLEEGEALPKWDDLTGLALREVALMSKSWDFLEASVGVAAINAFYNRPSLLDEADLTANTFDDYEEKARDKEVAIIGHFMSGSSFLANARNIDVLERRPHPGDYPDSACEYLLPQKDFVFVTGSALVNKTMPRLLKLSANAQTVILGPSTTMSPILFDYGADELSGLILEGIPTDTFCDIANERVAPSKVGRRICIRKESI